MQIFSFFIRQLDSPCCFFFFLILLRNNNPDVVCGQGTMGLEIVDQLEGVDAIIVPLGGGTLLAATCVSVKILYPSIKIIVCTFLYTSC